ncbi:amino acid permease [Sulfobacillus harzensis]|uniref:Amino acid permease n=1 Tax=Sulfobacillus harzensis TaxID=2729629 RepID=A0A7Y0Q2J5_9FIRM|nr:amino acid permease [Sulfobacillus harzensis]NMP22577.1 amino acid permease [Sulfobacillus harzensis]
MGIKTPNGTKSRHPRVGHGHRAFQKDLTSSTLTLLTIGGIMGSGLFMASGLAIRHAGPLVLAMYALGALMMILEINALAEMSVATPAPGSFLVYTQKVLGPGWTFVAGWIFWFSSVLTMSSEVTAASLFSRLFFPGVPLWGWSLAYSALIIAINFISVRGFGTIEGFMAGVKTIAVVLFIVFGVLMLLHVIPTHHPMTPLATLTGHGGLVPTGWYHALPAMILVLFAYAGTGVIGLAAAETRRPRDTIGRSVRNTTVLVTVMFLGSIAIILMVSPWNIQSDAISPFIVTLRQSRLAWTALVMNLVLLFAVLSTMNAALYSNVRVLYGLAQQGEAPRALGRLNKRGLPTRAIWTSAGLLALTILLAYVLPKKAYSYLVTATGFQAMFIWLMVLLTERLYRPYLEAHHPKKLSYKLWGFPFTTYLVMAVVLLSMAVSPFAKGELVGALVGLGGIAAALGVWLILRHRLRTAR